MTPPKTPLKTASLKPSELAQASKGRCYGEAILKKANYLSWRKNDGSKQTCLACAQVVSKRLSALISTVDAPCSGQSLPARDGSWSGAFHPATVKI
jgi:hypothetical protein